MKQWKVHNGVNFKRTEAIKIIFVSLRFLERNISEDPIEKRKSIENQEEFTWEAPKVQELEDINVGTLGRGLGNWSTEEKKVHKIFDAQVEKEDEIKVY